METTTEVTEVTTVTEVTETEITTLETVEAGIVEEVVEEILTPDYSQQLDDIIENQNAVLSHLQFIVIFLVAVILVFTFAKVYKLFKGIFD